MAKKETKKRTVVRGERVYEAFSSKIQAHAIGKKVAEKSEQHAPLIARVLLSFDKPVSVERIVTAAKNSGYDAKNAEHYIKGDLAFLVREGLAKVTKVEAANPNGSPKPKRARKPRRAVAAKSSLSEAPPSTAPEAAVA